MFKINSKTKKPYLKNNNNELNREGVNYFNRCNNCHMPYIGRKLNNLLYERKRNILQNNSLNISVANCNEFGNNFCLRNATLFKRASSLPRGKCIESAVIVRSLTFNLCPISYKI